MDISIRREQPADYRAVEELTREAFWNHFVPGCDEHYYLHLMRARPEFVPELDLVAEADGQIVGHIAYSRATIEGEGGERREVLCFGPVSVPPALQKQGIGSKLIRHSLDRARELGYDVVVILGDPRYYARFGFRSGEVYGIAASDGVYAVALMALALVPGALDHARGRFHELDYVPDEAAFAEFDKSFPPKEKQVTDFQRDFKILSSLRY